MDMNVLRIDDADYPAHLRSIKDPPLRLYYKGDLSLISKPAVAIVGTRRCSPYGRWAAKEIAKRVAGCGVPVVSGMAEGIDSAAHWGCLESGMGTVAVFGTGLDVCFPRSNSQLYAKIASCGLMLTEYEPGTEGLPAYFPQRNRIISGLAQSVVVVEGAIKSGSMITARLALEQGRDVFAVPGNINQPNSIGVNKLIADGACPIMELETVPELLGIGAGRIRRFIDRLTDEEKIIIGNVLEAPGITAEEIAMNSGLELRTASFLTSALELKGLVFTQGRRIYMAK